MNKKHVVISLTTIPSRITKIGPTIDSLINQSYKVDAIYISIPPFCDRLGTKYPEYVFPPEVTIIHPSKDYGPATKLLGLLECVDVKDYIVIVDDDRHYDKELVEKLLAKSDEEPNSIINGFPVKVQFAGAPGVLVRKQFIDKCIFKIPPFLKLHDDCWFTLYFQKRNIPVDTASIGNRLLFAKIEKIKIIVFKTDLKTMLFIYKRIYS